MAFVSLYCDRNMNDDISTWKIPENIRLRLVLSHFTFLSQHRDSQAILCLLNKTFLFVWTWRGLFQEREKKDEEANEFVSAVCWRTVSSFAFYWYQTTSETYHVTIEGITDQYWLTSRLHSLHHCLCEIIWDCGSGQRWGDMGNLTWIQHRS